jgi:putative transposase
MGKNCVYKKNSFIEFLIHLGLNQNFAESGSKIFKEFKGICPDADTLLYHLKKYSDTREIQRLYERLFEIIWDITKQSNAFDIRKRVDLAVDFTEWLYYGNRKTPMILGKMPERGTDKCYKFITINIVDSGKRFTLLALPVSNFDTKEVLLNKLIYCAKKRVKINRVYLDRGFFDSKSINVLNSSGVRWLIPGTMNPLIKKTLEISPAPTVITGFNMKHVRFNLAIGYDKNGEKRAMATNEQYNSNDVNFIDRLFILYSKRWGIETSYRVKKHSFRAKTTSKNYYIRLFYFLFSVLMYNLWILCDILIWLHLFGFIGEDHKITSKIFGTILIIIDPGG